MSENPAITDDPRLPLDGLTFSAGDGPQLRMHPSKNCARFSLHIAQENLKKATRAFGQDIPAKIGNMSFSGQKTALCLGPDEWFLLLPESEQAEIAAQFAKIYHHTPHSLVDVSYRTTGIDIFGPASALALNSACPLDLDNMADGTCARTIFDRTRIIVMKHKKQHYRIEIIRSYGQFVWDFLATAGNEFNTGTNS